MKNISLTVILSLFACLSFAQERNFRIVQPATQRPTTQERKAIVIGMSDYGEGKNLNNTLNDAADMAEVLTRLGFEVTLLKNNDMRNLRINLANWYSTIEGNDMAVFYFAGHGMEVDGDNYLIPVGAELNSQADVVDYTLKVNNVLNNMNEKRVGMKLLILDACRDNPFKRSWSRGSEEKGLAQMAAPRGTYIAFAASPGFTAQDGANFNLKNGVFTYFLKQEIIKAGITIDEIFNNVTGDVSSLTNEQQTPFKNSSLTKNFYFIPPENKPAPVSPLELLDKANKYYENKQYKDALPLYEQVANTGNTDAQYKLGVYYANGLGVARDNSQAVSWWKKAADGGSDIAQNYLGYYYENGLVGGKKDVEQAIAWYQKSADQGNITAQDALDRLKKPPVVEAPVVEQPTVFDVSALLSKADGLYSARQYSEAFPLYKQAADSGNIAGQNNLANCYYSGTGITRDYGQAMYWYKKAADQGSDVAQTNLGVCYEYGLADGIKNVDRAKEWYKKAASQGNANARNALDRLEKAAVADMQEKVRMADAFYGAKQYGNAFPLYKQAAESGNIAAQNRLGESYFRGNGVTKDSTQAVSWWKKAAEQGDATAQNKLGVCYYNGWGVTQDYAQAVEWYKKAAEQGKAPAQYNLGTCYEAGIGVEKDNTKAAYWYKKAADQGDKDARDALKSLK